MPIPSPVIKRSKNQPSSPTSHTKMSLKQRADQGMKNIGQQIATSIPKSVSDSAQISMSDNGYTIDNPDGSTIPPGIQIPSPEEMVSVLSKEKASSTFRESEIPNDEEDPNTTNEEYATPSLESGAMTQNRVELNLQHPIRDAPSPVTIGDQQDLLDAMEKKKDNKVLVDSPGASEDEIPVPSEALSVVAEVSDLKDIVEEQKAEVKEIKHTLESLVAKIDEVMKDRTTLATSVQSLSLELTRMREVERAIVDRATRDSTAESHSKAMESSLDTQSGISSLRAKLATSSAAQNLMMAASNSSNVTGKKVAYRDE